MHETQMDSREHGRTLEEILESSGILGRVPLSMLFPTDTLERLNRYFGYRNDEEDEEKKRRETERLRALFVIWLLAAEQWNLEGILDVSYERMQELAVKFADAVEEIRLIPETAETVPDAPDEAQDDAVTKWIDVLREKALETITAQNDHGRPAYSERVTDVLDQGEWLGILRSVDPVRPADPQEEQRAIEEVQLGVVGILTAIYSSRLIRSKDSIYDAECARSSFDDNAAQFADSEEFRQLCTGIHGRDPWEKAMNLRKFAGSDGGQRLVNEFARLREAGRKRKLETAEPEALSKPSKEMRRSK